MSVDTPSRMRFSTMRHPCPSCGSSRGFSPVVGVDGPDFTTGKCHACGEFIVPKKARPSSSSTRSSSWSSTSTPTSTATSSTHAVTADRLENLQRLHASTTADAVRFTNGLASFLLASSPTFADTLRRYDVGTDAAGRAVFWHRDEHGQILTGKSVPYDATTGKRDKAAALPAAFGVFAGPSFVSLSASKGYASPCLFGVHLLDDDLTRPVMLVESEKSAIVASLFLPDFVCVASGGATGMTRDKAKALTGRDVMIVGDRDEAGRKGAANAADILRSVGARPQYQVDGVHLCDLFMPDGGEGYDVADYYLSRLDELQAVNTATTTVDTVDTRAANAPQAAEGLEADTMPDAVDRTSPRPQEGPTWTPSRECPTDDAAVYALALRAFGQDDSTTFDEINRRCVDLRLDGGAQVITLAIVRGYVGVRNGWNGRPYTAYLTGRRPNA